jgi:O-Antigen ligase
VDSDDRTAWNAPALAALIAAALLPALLTIYFSFQSGGYFPGAPALIGAQLALLLALRIALARRPLEGVSPTLLVAVAALAAFAAWVLASSQWSDSPARAVPEYTRVLAYLLALALFGSLPFSARRLRWMAYALAAGIVGVCAVSFLSRTMPDLVSGAGELQPSRLSYPLDYWNSLGLLAGLGVILCGHLACASRDHWAARVAGAAAVPLLTATLYYTFSRGATWATLAGIAVYVIVGRPRGLLAGVLATVPPTIVTLMAINPASALTSKPRFAPDTIATGHRTALIVLGCVLAAGAIRAATLRLDSGLEGLSIPRRLRRPVLTGAGIATVVVALAASAALHVPDVVAEKYRDFNSDDARVGDSGSSRLLSGSDNGRRDHWEVSVSAVKREPLHGDGAGSYEIDWTRDRDSALDVHDGHSLYLETLGELGVVGLGLLLICLLVLLGGFAARARGPNRALFAALLGVGVAWALAAAVDWDWEMPAVTIWLFGFGGAALARPRAERVPEVAEKRSGGVRAGQVALRCAGVAACLAVAILPARLAVSEAHYERSLDSLAAGDCVDARAEANAALDALGSRAAPHHVKAWCEIQAGRYNAAARDLEEGLRNDPDNWALVQALAVTRGRAGLDPRPEARRTAALNPLGELAVATREALRGGRPAGWRRAASGLEVTVPESGDR